MIINILNRALHEIFILTLVIFIILPYPSCCQVQKKTVPDANETILHTVNETDSVPGIVTKPDPTKFDGPYSTFKVGLGFIYDFTTYKENDVFKKQMDSAGFNLVPTFKLRDFRILGSGTLKTKRPISWKFAYMWDGDAEQWLVRESGIIVGVPEIHSNFFIGRTKEGYSLVKVMNGHSPWTMERQMAVDMIPIIADGIRWYGFLPKSRIFWNLGYYNDLVSKGQKFSTLEWQYVARVGWMPLYDKATNKVLHFAINYQYSKPLDGKMTLKSRPESNPTPQILNTGSFPADHSSHIGAEIYYNNGKSLMIGSEIALHNFYSDTSENHKFYGGDIVISYIFSGAVRPYTTTGNIFGFVPVRKSIFKGGWGEWEGVLRFSTLNLNDRSIKGGQFWRITPMVNWYMSKVIRMEFTYGYGIFDRYEMRGKVQFFESRIQFTIM